MRATRVTVSAVMLSVCLLARLSENMYYASTFTQPFIQVTDNYRMGNYQAAMSFASLAITIIGLIVLWTGYQKSIRWSWFVMFIVVWVFFFPVYIVPIVVLLRYTNFSGVTWEAIRRLGPVEREVWGRIILFLTMLIGLFLPLTSFFGKKSVPQPNRSIEDPDPVPLN
jgi:MFS family permease